MIQGRNKEGQQEMVLGYDDDCIRGEHRILCKIMKTGKKERNKQTNKRTNKYIHHRCDLPQSATGGTTHTHPQCHDHLARMGHVKKIRIGVALVKVHRRVVSGHLHRVADAVGVRFGFFVHVGPLGTAADDHRRRCGLEHVRHEFVQRFEGPVTSKTGIVRFGAATEDLVRIGPGQLDLVPQTQVYNDCPGIGTVESLFPLARVDQYLQQRFVAAFLVHETVGRTGQIVVLPGDGPIGQFGVIVRRGTAATQLDAIPQSIILPHRIRVEGGQIARLIDARPDPPVIGPPPRRRIFDLAVPRQVVVVGFPHVFPPFRHGREGS